MSRGQTWRDQRERRFLLGGAAVAGVLGAIEERLPRVSYVPGTTRSRVVTSYLDSVDNDYLDLVERTSGRLSLKMRVREYIALFEGNGAAQLAPTATCFLERKQRAGDLRVKQRIELPKREIGRVLRKETALSGDRAVVAALRGELDTRVLAPVLVSAYVRRVYGSDQGLRITLDEEIAFHAPVMGLYDSVAAMTPEVLGPPVGLGPERILEVKEPRGHGTPAWLATLLGTLTPADRFSKFREGMRVLGAWQGEPRRQARASSG